MNGTTIHSSHAATSIAQEIVAVRRRSEELIREHDVILGSILEDARENPLMQINLYRILEVVREQTELLHLLDRRLSLLENAIGPGTEPM